VKNGEVDAVEADLSAISRLIANDQEFRMFLMSPARARDEKIQFAESVFSDRATALTMQFLRLLLEKRREGEFEEIREQFVSLRRQHGNVIYAEITSSKPLGQMDRDALERQLTTKTGKRIEAAYDVDPAVIGGVKVAYGNYVLDGTVKGTLRRLKDRLRHDLLKEI